MTKEQLAERVEELEEENATLREFLSRMRDEADEVLADEDDGEHAEE